MNYFSLLMKTNALVCLIIYEWVTHNMFKPTERDQRCYDMSNTPWDMEAKSKKLGGEILPILFLIFLQNEIVNVRFQIGISQS